MHQLDSIRNCRREINLSFAVQSFQELVHTNLDVRGLEREGEPGLVVDLLGKLLSISHAFGNCFGLFASVP